ncbi:BglG family transcription antiterminator [Erwinia sp. 198]|uniref:BglG family transcription antiterminator n=1 Tax=Erwinia sp. 198 TaxID=2022746 RepID=UPI0013158C2B|nr:BglG family transcription antiterminator [Erwinia sp. 198]
MMKHYPSRIFQLLALLQRAEKPLSSVEICRALAIKPRTLRSDLLNYRKDLAENGITLLSRPGVGYRLQIEDEKKYQQLKTAFRQAEYRHYFDVPVRYAQRVRYLIRTLLSVEGYIKLDELADKIYISRSALNDAMKEVRLALKPFNLTLKGRSGCGIRVEGSELNLRQAMARYLYYDDAALFQQDGVPASHPLQKNGSREKIVAILHRILEKHGITLTETGFQNLVIHLEIALMRVKLCRYKPLSTENLAALEGREEYRLAEQLIAAIEQEFSLSLPCEERYFTAIHLAGKRHLQPDAPVFTSPDISRLYEKITAGIAARFGINLADDSELRSLLLLHFIPMLDRLCWDLKIHNPLLEQIKQENLSAFEIAVLAGKIIQQETGLAVNEAETGYLAVHFALALERCGRQRQYNIILVCASGQGSSQLLLYTLRQRFRDESGKVKVVQLYELNQIDFTGYDIVLSTIDIPFAVPVPLLRVSCFLGDRELNQLENQLKDLRLPRTPIRRYFHPALFFTDLQSTERYALIEELCQRLSGYLADKEHFLQRVIEREALSATEFGNAVAFPHPLYPCGEQTFVAVAVLPKPIKWEKQSIRYVFMLCLRKGEKDPLQALHESLVTLMCDEEKLKRLGEKPTFSTLLGLLQAASPEEK